MAVGANSLEWVTSQRASTYDRKQETESDPRHQWSTTTSTGRIVIAQVGYHIGTSPICDTRCWTIYSLRVRFYSITAETDIAKLPKLSICILSDNGGFSGKTVFAGSEYRLVFDKRNGYTGSDYYHRKQLNG